MINLAHFAPESLMTYSFDLHHSLKSYCLLQLKISRNTYISLLVSTLPFYRFTVVGEI